MQAERQVATITVKVSLTSDEANAICSYLIRNSTVKTTPHKFGRLLQDALTYDGVHEKL